MDKAAAIGLFGTQAEMARQLTVSASAITQWPPVLTRRQVHEVVGAALLAGKITSLDEVATLLTSSDGASCQAA